MNAFKRYLGLLLLIIGPLFIYELVAGAIANIDTAGKKDINNSGLLKSVTKNKNAFPSSRQKKIN